MPRWLQSHLPHPSSFKQVSVCSHPPWQATCPMPGCYHLLGLPEAHPLPSQASCQCPGTPETGATLFPHWCAQLAPPYDALRAQPLCFLALWDCFPSSAVGSKSNQSLKPKSCWKFPTFPAWAITLVLMQVRIPIYIRVTCPFDPNHKRNGTSFCKGEGLWEKDCNAINTQSQEHNKITFPINIKFYLLCFRLWNYYCSRIIESFPPSFSFLPVSKNIAHRCLRIYSKSKFQ